MERQLKISVITVVRNDVQHIEETMLSVLNQTYPIIEYIVIDGASTDGTWEKIQQYSGRLAYSISEPDRGIYDAMNKGIKAITGDWCIFMNCGDLFYNESVVATIFKDFVDMGESILYGDVCLRNGKKERFIKARAQKSKMKECMPSYHQATFIKASEIIKYPYDLRYKIIADYAFFYQLFRRNNKYKYYPLIVCQYDGNGISSRLIGKIKQEKMMLYLRNFDIRFFQYALMCIKESFKK